MCCRILIFENQQFHVELWGNKKKWLFLMQKTGLLSPEYFTAMLKFANECKNWPTNFQAEVYHSTLVVYLESRQSSIPCKKARTCKNKNTNMQKEESRSQTSMLCKEEKKEGSGRCVAKFMVPVSHEKGIVKCYQYEGRINGEKFVKLIDEHFLCFYKRKQ